MKKGNITAKNNPSGKVFCRKSSRDFVQDTIFRIGKLQDHLEKAGMQLANTMPRSLFIQKDKSGGNDV